MFFANRNVKSILSLLLFCFPVWLLAAGNMGKDLQYECLGVVGGNIQYRVTARYFWHCWDYVNGSVSAAPPATLTLKAVGCAVNTTFVLNQDNTGTCPDQSGCSITPLCAAQLNQGACNWASGGNPPFQGIRVYRYTATILLPIGCSQIYLGIDECCRAGNVSNIVSPTVAQGAILAMVNTANDPLTGLPYCNNSPRFTQMPEPFVCRGSDVNINYGVTEGDNDSLVYALVTPLQGTVPPYTNSTFNAAWNVNNPVRTTVPNSFGFNTQTGQMTFIPSTVEQDVITVRVNEYRNGVLVGSTMRDIVLSVNSCFTAPPIIHPIASVVNATQTSPTSVQVCPGTAMTMRLFYTDPTNRNITSAVVTASQEIQGALVITDSLVGTAPNDSAYKIIRWTPTLADTGCYTFTLTVTNDDCPVNGITTQGYQVCVLRKASVNPHNSLYCGTPIQLTASGGTNPTWTPAAGLSTTVGYSVLATPTLNTRYTFSSDCGIDTAWVVVTNIFNMDAGPGGQICRNGQIQLNATRNNVYPSYSIKWSPSAGLLDPVTGLPNDSIFNPIASPFSTTTYTATVTASNGCSRKDTVTVFVSGVSPVVQANITPDIVCPGYPVTLTAVSVPAFCGMPISTCTGQNVVALLTNNPTVQTGSATQYPSPYGNYFRGARHQYLIKASELQPLVGPYGGQIKSLAMNIAVLNSNSALQGFTIKMACTSEDSLTSYQGNLVTVFTPKNIIPALGWNTHVFDQVYDWDGTSNVVVDICFYNPSGGALNNKMQVNPTAYRSQWFTWSNVQPMCDISGTQPVLPTYATYFERPSFQFNVCLFDMGNTTFQWTPSTGVNAPSPINNDTTVAHPMVTTTYTVNVSDAGGCTASDFVTAMVDTSLRFSVSPDTMTCNASPVQLHAVAIGTPTAPNFTYTWTASAGVPPPSGTGAAFANPTVTPTQTTTYVCTLTGGQCTLVDSVTITYGSNIPTAIQIDSITCFNAANGRLRTVLGGGTAPYSFVWSANASSTVDSAINIAPGTYSVTVTDRHACTGTASVQVTQPPLLTVVLDSTRILCYGGNNGSITATANGGTPGYTYNWNNGFSVNPLSNLQAGNYSVTVRDSKQCSATASASLGQPQLLSVGIINTDSALCFNTATGSATASTTGGTGTYSYLWSAGASTTNVNNNLPAGPGFVVVSDVNLCRDTTTFIIYQPTQLQLSVSAISASCATSGDGIGDASASGGTGAYTYVWDGVVGTNPQSNLAAGTHTVVVSDVNNCTVSGSVFVDTLYRLRLSMVVTPTSCFGSADGTVEAIPLNGSPNYQYAWSVVGSGGTVSGPAGPVAVTVTDVNLCSATATATITEPLQIQIATGTQSPSCIGRSDGMAWASTSNGTAPYSYGWSNFDNMDTARNLLAGTYQVSVYDANLCSATASVTLSNPTTVVASLLKTEISCFGENDGEVSVSASGGVQPYTYLWNDFYTSPNRIDIAPGTYQITVSDANGCDTSLQVTFVSPSEISWVSVVADSVSCPLTEDGLILLTGAGGNPPYTYSLDNVNYQSGNLFSDLAKGDYTVYLKDANGCTIDSSTFIGAPPELTFSVQPKDSVLVYGNSLQFIVITNNYPYAWMNNYTWTPAEGLSCSDCLNPIVSTYTDQTYTLTINYGDGCVAVDSITVYADAESGTALYIPNAFSPDGNGRNDVFYIFGRTIRSVEFRIFNRWGEKIFETNNAWVGWDGTYKSAEMPAGVYTYDAVINYLTGKKVHKKGSITLIR